MGAVNQAVSVSCAHFPHVGDVGLPGLIVLHEPLEVVAVRVHVVRDALWRRSNQHFRIWFHMSNAFEWFHLAVGRVMKLVSGELIAQRPEQTVTIWKNFANFQSQSLPVRMNRIRHCCWIV